MSDQPDTTTEETTDGRTVTATDEPPADDDAGATTTENRGLSDRAAFWVSGVLALILSVGSVWLIGVQAVHFEALQRVGPSVDGGGVGAAWVQGNTLPALDWMITLTHFADVIMGVFILVMVFIHWIAFRRLAARMRPPNAPQGQRTDDAVATDGGSEARPEEAPRNCERTSSASSAPQGGERSEGPQSTSDRRSDGGEAE